MQKEEKYLPKFHCCLQLGVPNLLPESRASQRFPHKHLDQLSLLKNGKDFSPFHQLKRETHRGSPVSPITHGIRNQTQGQTPNNAFLFLLLYQSGVQQISHFLPPVRLFRPSCTYPWSKSFEQMRPKHLVSTPFYIGSIDLQGSNWLILSSS